MTTSSSEMTYDRINDYASVRISLARPHDIRSWSFGEVRKPETINYRTFRPERDGLFCERIFGPEKDWECACGKYRGMKFKGMICDRCGVKITHSRVRRKRMGHIELKAPVVHIWFFKATPSRLGALLAMKTTHLEKVIYFQDYVVTDPGETSLKAQQLLTEEECRQARMDYGPDAFRAEMGAEAIRQLLMGLELVTLSRDLRVELAETNSKQRKKDLVNRLKIVEALRDSDNQPAWMVLDVIPVIPPDLRPLVVLESGSVATSDLNDLYRRIINRNNRLGKLIDLNAPEVIIRNEKRMLQQAVDALFDNGRCKRPVTGASNRPLKSLTDMIKGKQGRFRENLLGKRVDYSARSVIVVGPTLRLHQCGLPKKIALELYQPFIIRCLKERRHADTIKSAKKMLERKDEEVWDILEEVIRNHPVLLNRAPTLHRMGIQAFEPILVEGNAIKLHPLVCKGFNADFDGDQMAVHLPLSIESQVEAHTLMLSTNNIFSPSSGRPIISPSQDVVMGCYYMTMEIPDRDGDGMSFTSVDELELAWMSGRVATHASVTVRLPAGRRLKGDISVEMEDRANLGYTDDSGRVVPETAKRGIIVKTTVGRVIFNQMLPSGMPYYNEPMRSKTLAMVIADCYEILGRRATIDLLDEMNRFGFRYATWSGLSFATDDLITPASKWEIIAEAEEKVRAIMKQFGMGQITHAERYGKVIEEWTKVRERITEDMMAALENDHRYRGYVNPIFLMAQSGARGGKDQIRQLAGMRGLMAKPSGAIIETPIRANFREGLTVLEYFSSTHGARKGLADTALKTADSGYLTRKLADVAQNVVVTMHDCGTSRCITKGVYRQRDEVVVPLSEAIHGRVSCQDFVDLVSDQRIVRENGLITAEIARKIEALGLEKIWVRSPMTCEAPLGVCSLCYGMDLSTGQLVEEGMAVGIIAAQSIGEPGTQLTMRTFHIGGAAAASLEEKDIRARRAGTVHLDGLHYVRNGTGQLIVLGRNGVLVLRDPRGREIERYEIPLGTHMLIEDRQEVHEKQILCEWDPHAVPILSEKAGVVQFEDVVDGETLLSRKDEYGTVRHMIVEHKGELRPKILVVDPVTSGIIGFHYLPEKAYLEVDDGEEISAGTVLAKTPREMSGTQDITGGLPRVTEVFEARKPKDPAVIAEIDGTVSIPEEKFRGKRKIVITNEATGIQREHLVEHGKHLRFHNGDAVRAGDPLVDGPLVPHDILRISGENRVQNYLVGEIQSVYRSQSVEIHDKHIEVIVAQMLRKRKVETVGDTGLLEGSVIDKHEFEDANRRLQGCVKVTDPGDTDLREGECVRRETFEQKNAEVMADGGRTATCVNPRPATATPQLLGITKAAVQSQSFISAASFQETTKVLTEAALAGKVDNLIGLKENVILGHLIPAGTGFRLYQNAEVRLRAGAQFTSPSAPSGAGASLPGTDFALLDDSSLMAAVAAGNVAAPTPESRQAADALDDLLGG